MKYIPTTTVGSPANLLAAWDAADAAMRQAGQRWYEDAHAALVTIGEDTGYRLDTVTGVAAVISPFIAWDQNLAATLALLRGQSAGGFGHNRTKAQAIIAGGDPLKIISGPKVRAFYENLRWPGEAKTVVVDRHIARLWVAGSTRGQYGCKPKTYQQIATDTIVAARSVGEAVHAFQATIWLYARTQERS